MKNLLLSTLLLAAACGPARNIFEKDTTPREAYERQLDRQGVNETPAYREWKAAAAGALAHPLSIALPYRQSGQFGSDKPRALALRLSAVEGQRIEVALDERVAGTLYLELFRADGTLLYSADTLATAFQYPIDAAGDYLLRLQPGIGHAGRYSLSIQKGPSLAFPVAGKHAKAGSFWGADRDGGARRHEGVDIFAPKGTPAIAAAAGVVTSVAEGGLGGKYVFLRPEGRAYNLYYAHLDQQWVQPGQRVKAGDTLGLVGNTGNARNTPPHLHFGVYGFKGAVDPYPFINRSSAEAAALPQRTFPAAIRVKKSKETGGLPVNTQLVPLGLTARGWIAELPDGKPVLLPFSAVQSV
ncbi:MAG: M23 family metallopeptidase [Chitinophagaceae bacterium]|nr:MAG: M23 family metallopeptidase [Chitinophagaceae bacterium]